jgi:hypothetical protein
MMNGEDEEEYLMCGGGIEGSLICEYEKERYLMRG